MLRFCTFVSSRSEYIGNQRFEKSFSPSKGEGEPSARQAGALPSPWHWGNPGAAPPEPQPAREGLGSWLAVGISLPAKPLGPALGCCISIVTELPGNHWGLAHCSLINPLFRQKLSCQDKAELCSFSPWWGLVLPCPGQQFCVSWRGWSRAGSCGEGGWAE